MTKSAQHKLQLEQVSWTALSSCICLQSILILLHSGFQRMEIEGIAMCSKFKSWCIPMLDGQDHAGNLLYQREKQKPVKMDKKRSEIFLCKQNRHNCAFIRKKKRWKKSWGLTYNNRFKASQKPGKHDFSVYSEQEAFTQGGNYLRLEIGWESVVSLS